MTIDSVFPMASQTKPTTAAVIMALAERGMIGLTESVSATLPELADDHRDVMVFHLLTHTSGWSDDDYSVLHLLTHTSGWSDDDYSVLRLVLRLVVRLLARCAGLRWDTWSDRELTEHSIITVRTFPIRAAPPAKSVGRERIRTAP